MTVDGGAVTVDPGLARRSVGPIRLGFYSVSASAPMTTLVAGIGTTFAATGVLGVPLSYLILGIALWWLSTGYVAMNRHLGHTAPFVAVLAHGLGRAAGVAGGLLVVVAYISVQVALYAYVGSAVAEKLGGPWLFWSAVTWMIIGVLGATRVDIVANVLAGLLVVEIILIGAIDIAAFTHPAGGQFTLEGLSWGQLFASGGDVGGVFALGVAGFLGYETGQAYAEEARTDSRITHWTLLVLAPLYAVSALAMIIGVGPANIQKAAEGDLVLPLSVLADQLGIFGPLIFAIGQALLLTSVGGALLSFHAATSRYLYAMAREQLLPGRLQRTGDGDTRSQRDAPVTASVVQGLLTAAVLTCFAVAGADPQRTVFTWLAALAAFTIITLLILASVSALLWFQRGGGAGRNGVWTRWAAPCLGITVGVIGLGVMTARMHTLLGLSSASQATALAIPLIVAAALLAGVLWGSVVHLVSPGIYEGIGRSRPHPFALPDQRLSEVKL